MARCKRTICKLLTVFTILAMLTSCHNYYKVSPYYSPTTATKAAGIDSMRLSNRYFILRSGSAAFYIKNPSLSADQKTMDCTLDSVPYYHMVELRNEYSGNKRYKNGNPLSALVLNEVHLYIPQDNAAVFGPYKLQLDQIQKIEVIEKDAKRTTNSYIIGALGYTLGTLVVAGVIIMATKSSCPFVSAYDGTRYALQGEIYGGAIYPQLARDDYMPLKMQPLQDGSLQVKISNELHEHQFTDMADLWVITHDKKSRVLADEKGNLYNITKPQLPIKALLNGKKDITAALKETGDNVLVYMDDSTTLNATNEAILTFKKPAAAKNSKLILSLKNSYFLDLLYGELAKGFGSYYGTYINQQRKKPVAELVKWTEEQQIPLKVSIKTIDGWKKINAITTIGPLATRNIIVPVELPITTEPFAEIKLSSGFMFWEIDYAAMDYTTGENDFTVEKVNPSKATDELGKNILAELQKEDGIYLAQPDIGNVATIVYNTGALTDTSKIRTYILHSKGYYEHVRDFKNSPNIAFLNQFKRPNAFPLFGVTVYKKIAEQNKATLAAAH